MRQRAVRVGVVAAVCIAAGAVMTVATAWGLALGNRWTAPSPRRLINGKPAGWDIPPDSFGVDHRMIARVPGVEGEPQLRAAGIERRMDAGVPWRSMRLARSLGDRDPPSNVPTTPLWPGFAIDTALYGSLTLLLWRGPGARRRARLRRGECVACGYPRAGLASDAACPECGAG